MNPYLLKSVSQSLLSPCLDQKRLAVRFSLELASQVDCWSGPAAYPENPESLEIYLLTFWWHWAEGRKADLLVVGSNHAQLLLLLYLIKNLQALVATLFLWWQLGRYGVRKTRESQLRLRLSLIRNVHKLQPQTFVNDFVKSLHIYNFQTEIIASKTKHIQWKACLHRRG